MLPRKLGRVIARGRVGRVLHYYTFQGMTVALAQDGDGGQAKIYVDRNNPIGIAEVAAFGGSGALQGFPVPKIIAPASQLCLRSSGRKPLMPLVECWSSKPID